MSCAHAGPTLSQKATAAARREICRNPARSPGLVTGRACHRSGRRRGARLEGSWRVGCLGVVDVSCGGDGCDPVYGSGVVVADGADGPAGGFAGVVAAGADGAAVAVAGRAAVGPAVDVVDLADRRITIRRAAVLVADGDQVGEEPVEASSPRIAADKHAAGRGGEQPAAKQATPCSTCLSGRGFPGASRAAPLVTLVSRRLSQRAKPHAAIVRGIERSAGLSEESR